MTQATPQIAVRRLALLPCLPLIFTALLVPLGLPLWPTFAVSALLTSLGLGWQLKRYCQASTDAFHTLMATLPVDSLAYDRAVDTYDWKQIYQGILQLQEQLQRTDQQLQHYETKLVQQTEAAAVAQQAKSEFLSSISHELRTPLNGILGYTQVLRRSSGLRPNHINGLNIIHQSGTHLLRIINDILDFARIEAHRLVLQTDILELGPFLDGIVGPMRIRAEEKGVIFQVEQQQLPCRVVVDEKRLRQVLINLLDNAVKFTGSGQIILRVQSQNVPDDQSTIVLGFRVNDTGIGIAEDAQELIFLPFEQSGNRSNRAEGTGLGLAISRQLVRLMGGELRVQSQLGKGSQFFFSLALPRLDGDNRYQDSNQLWIQGYHGKRRTLLLADEDPNNREILEKLLTAVGFQVLTAEDGEQTQQLLFQQRPDLLLIDLILPVKSGFKVVRELRRHRDFLQLPIIAVSTHVFESDVLRSRAAGCSAFLAKPVVEQQLFDTLAQLLDLQWFYGPPPANPSPADTTLTATLPTVEDLQDLHEMAQIGKVHAIRERAEQLALQAEYRPFAERLKRLARNFEDEELLALIEQGLREKGISVADNAPEQTVGDKAERH